MSIHPCRSLVLAFLLWAGLAAPACFGGERAVAIGILAPEGAEEAGRDWLPMVDYLQAALPDTAVRLRFLDLDGVHRAVAGGDIDFVITNSGDYVELESAHGVHRIATLEMAPYSPREAIASAVVVRAGRDDLQRLADLAGKRVLAVGERAFGGYRVAWRELRQQGIEPPRDFGQLRFSGFPLQNIVLAVGRGEADAGIVRACVLENMARRGEIDPRQFRVLGVPAGDRFPCLRSTRVYPDWPIAALPGTPHALSKQVARALLAMPAGGDGIAWTVPTDYESVRELFRELRIGPYADLEAQSLGALLSRYRWWLLAAGLLVLGWGMHAVRAEYLVHARTRELRAALEAREAMEREARDQQEKLDHLARLGILGELSSMLAHELNQPLSAIGNFAQGMERRIEAGRLEPDALLAGTREISEQAERARAIMQRIRGFARKRAESRAPLRLAETIDNAVGLFQGIGGRAPRVEREVDPDATAVADRLQIEQVLLNLLKNGLDAMEKVPEAARRLAITCRRDGAAHRICVRDNGCGLDGKAAERLFEPFFTTKPEGLGIGLSLCRSIVEAHGGRLWAEDNPDGKGIAMCFTLPIQEQGGQA